GTDNPYGYRTLGKDRRDAVRRLCEAGLEGVLPSVPGFVLKEQGEGPPVWSLTGRGGILVPVRDVRRRIVGLKVRADDGGEPRYAYLSSKKHGGAGPGSPVHVPPFEGGAGTVRVTEGELKADVATALGGVLTVGLPGVSAWRQAAGVLRD